MKLIFKSKTKKINYLKPILVGNQKLSSIAILEYEIFKENDPAVFTLGTLQFLPNFHESNISDLDNFLHLFFENYSLQFTQIELTKPFFNIVQFKQELTAEYLYCIEAIFFQILFYHFQYLLPEITQASIKVNSLISLDGPQTSNPSSCVKIKIRPNFTQNTFANMKDIFDKNKNVLVRLDGNRQFNANQLCHFLDKLAEAIGEDKFNQIEYIEEPLLDPKEYVKIFNSFKIPLALDESVMNYKIFLDEPYISTLVLKPSVLSLSECFKLLDQTKLNIVISSTYETAQSLLGHLFLASYRPKTFHGLGTLDFLPKNYTTIPTPFFLSK